MIDGDEIDGLNRCKRYIKWKPNTRKAIKRKYNKRQRKQARAILWQTNLLVCN